MSVTRSMTKKQKKNNDNTKNNLTNNDPEPISAPQVATSEDRSISLERSQSNSPQSEIEKGPKSRDTSPPLLATHSDTSSNVPLESSNATRWETRPGYLRRPIRGEHINSLTYEEHHIATLYEKQDEQDKLIKGMQESLTDTLTKLEKIITNNYERNSVETGMLRNQVSELCSNQQKITSAIQLVSDQCARTAQIQHQASQQSSSAPPTHPRLVNNSIYSFNSTIPQIGNPLRGNTTRPTRSIGVIDLTGETSSSDRTPLRHNRERSGNIAPPSPPRSPSPPSSDDQEHNNGDRFADHLRRNPGRIPRPYFPRPRHLNPTPDTRGNDPSSGPPAPSYSYSHYIADRAPPVHQFPPNVGTPTSSTSMPTITKVTDLQKFAPVFEGTNGRPNTLIAKEFLETLDEFVDTFQPSWEWLCFLFRHVIFPKSSPASTWWKPFRNNATSSITDYKQFQRHFLDRWTCIDSVTQADLATVIKSKKMQPRGAYDFIKSFSSEITDSNLAWNTLYSTLSKELRTAISGNSGFKHRFQRRSFQDAEWLAILAQQILDANSTEDGVTEFTSGTTSGYNNTSKIKNNNDNQQSVIAPIISTSIINDTVDTEGPTVTVSKGVTPEHNQSKAPLRPVPHDPDSSAFEPRYRDRPTSPSPRRLDYDRDYRYNSRNNDNRDQYRRNSYSSNYNRSNTYSNDSYYDRRSPYQYENRRYEDRYNRSSYSNYPQSPRSRSPYSTSDSSNQYRDNNHFSRDRGSYKENDRRNSNNNYNNNNGNQRSDYRSDYRRSQSPHRRSPSPYQDFRKYIDDDRGISNHNPGVNPPVDPRIHERRQSDNQYNRPEETDHNTRFNSISTMPRRSGSPHPNRISSTNVIKSEQTSENTTDNIPDNTSQCNVIVPEVPPSHAPIALSLQPPMLFSGAVESEDTIRSCDILFDTGSQENVLSSKIFDEYMKLEHFAKPAHPGVRIIDAQAQPLKIIGELSKPLKIKIKDTKNEYKTYILNSAKIVENLPYPVLIGLPFIAQHDFIIRASQNLISCGSEKFIVKTNQAVMPILNVPAKAEDAVTVQPFQTVKLKLIIENDKNENTQQKLYLFEPEEKVEKKLGVNFTAAVISTDRPCIFVTNLECCPITINSDSKIGSVRLVQPAMVQTEEQYFDNPSDTHVMALKTEPQLKIDTPSENKEVVLPALPEDMPTDLRPVLQELLQRYKHLFDGILSEESFGGVQHEIAIKPGSSPVFVRPYKYKPEHLPILRELMEKYIQEGIIEEATGAWCSPSFFVPKPHGGWRFVVDLRKLNEVIVRDRYQMPTVREIFDQLHGSVLFTSADGHSGFTQLCLHPDSRKYTGFSTPLGFYQYKRLPQGIVNGPPAYSREMARALHHIDFARNYVDDIIIHTRVPAGIADDVPQETKMRRAWESHIDHLRTVFARCSELNIKLNPKKVIIGRKQIEFLGHIVSSDGLRPSPKKIQAISTLKPPTDVNQLRKFLGMVNYYTAFIPRKAAIQQPLNKLLTKTQPWEWNDIHQTAWETLKNSLTTDCVRAYPDPTKPFVMSTDASGYAIANILSQPDDPNNPLGPGKVLEYNSRTMTDAEKNYTVHEQELLSVIVGFHTWTQYLLHAEVHVVTDHASLKTIISWKQPSARIIRWRIKLADFNYTIHYRKGSDNAVADALSRLPSDNITNMISNSNGRIPTKQERLEAEAAFDKDEDYLLPQIVPAVAMITTDPYSTPPATSHNLHNIMTKTQQVLLKSTDDTRRILRKWQLSGINLQQDKEKLTNILSNLLQLYNQFTITMVRLGYPIVDNIESDNILTVAHSIPSSQTSTTSATSHQSLITDYYPPQIKTKLNSTPTTESHDTRTVLMMSTDNQRYRTRLSTGSIDRQSFSQNARQRRLKSVLFQDNTDTQPHPHQLIETNSETENTDQTPSIVPSQETLPSDSTPAQTIDQIRPPALEDTIENLDEGCLPRDHNVLEHENPQPTVDEFAVPEIPDSPRIDHTDDSELSFYDTNEMDVMRKYIGQEFFDTGILFKLQDIWQDENGDCFGLRVPVLIPLLDVPEHVAQTILPLDYFISRLSTNTTEDLADIIHNRLNDRYLNEVLDDVKAGIEQGRLRMADLCYMDAPGGGQHLFRVYRDKSTNITYYQFIISSKDKVSQQLFLQYCHDHTGHFGVNKTLKQLLMRVYWIGIHDSVQDHIKSCRECQERKGRSPRAPTIPILRHPIPMAPCERWSVDIVGPFPRSSSGNNQALLAVCHMSKFMIGVPMPNKSAPTVLHATTQNLFYVFGDSNVMLTDRAQELSLSHLNRDVFAQFNIFNQRTASYSPWMNGQVERLNAVIEAILSKYCENEDHSDWDVFLASAVFAHNTTVSATTGFTPYFMLYGREAKTTLDRIYPLHIHEKYRDKSHAAYAKALIHRLKEAYAHCAKNIDTTQSTYNKPEVLQDLLERTMTNKPFFKTGDLVMMRVPSAYTPGNSRKLTRYWSGPFVVTKELNPTYFQIANNKGKHNASAFKLKKFELREPFQPVILPIRSNFRDNLQERTSRRIHYNNFRNRRNNRDSGTQTTNDNDEELPEMNTEINNESNSNENTAEVSETTDTYPNLESKTDSNTEQTNNSTNNMASTNKHVTNCTTLPPNRPMTRSYRLRPKPDSIHYNTNINCISRILTPIYVNDSPYYNYNACCVLYRVEQQQDGIPSYQTSENGAIKKTILAPLQVPKQTDSGTNMIISHPYIFDNNIDIGSPSTLSGSSTDYSQTVTSNVSASNSSSYTDYTYYANGHNDNNNSSAPQPFQGKQCNPYYAAENSNCTMGISHASTLNNIQWPDPININNCNTDAHSDIHISDLGTIKSFALSDIETWNDLLTFSPNDSIFKENADTEDHQVLNHTMNINQYSFNINAIPPLVDNNCPERFQSYSDLFSLPEKYGIVKASTINSSDAASFYLRRFTITPKRRDMTNTKESSRQRGSCVSGKGEFIPIPGTTIEIITDNWSLFSAVLLLLDVQLSTVSKVYNGTFYDQKDSPTIDTALYTLCHLDTQVQLPQPQFTSQSEINDLHQLQISYRGLCLQTKIKAVIILSDDTSTNPGLPPNESPTEYTLADLSTRFRNWNCTRYCTPFGFQSQIHLVTPSQEATDQLNKLMNKQCDVLSSSAAPTTSSLL